MPTETRHPEKHPRGPHRVRLAAHRCALTAGALALAGCAAARTPHCAQPSAPPLDAVCLAAQALPHDRPSHEHLLRRLTFGARPRDLERLERLGVARWLERQLEPERLRDAASQRALEPYRLALRPPDELWALHDDDPNAIAPAMLAPPGAMTDPMMVPPETVVARPSRNAQREQLEGALMMSALARHLVSDRQVLEVMTDLFTNHFNVHARKGNVRYLAADLVERAIRPHALGSFAEMLTAVARHPAMLLYLDNARSVAPRPAVPGRPLRGLNENYARELLELHTLGVDAGYTQQDVREVARALTGWGVSNPNETGSLVFEFRLGHHDRTAKHVAFLSLDLPANGGEDEGLRVLAALARHPRTARTVARKMAQRFVADEPPEALVEALAQSYLRTDGSLASMLRTLVAHPLFWAPEARLAKVKTPLEYVLSALRALDARPNGSDRLARVLLRMGHGPFMNPVPTGYSDDGRRLGGSALIDRMNLAMDVADGSFDGVSFELDRLVPEERDPARLVETVTALFLPAEQRAATQPVLLEAVRGLAPSQARRVAVALALSSPAFQRQ